MACESVMFLLPMSFVPAIHFYDPAMKGNGVSDGRGGRGRSGTLCLKLDTRQLRVLRKGSSVNYVYTEKETLREVVCIPKGT